MRVTAQQLLIDGVQRVFDGEESLFGGHLRIEDSLQNVVAELFREIGPVAAVDGVEHLVGLFQRVGLDAVEGLLTVPRAAAGRAQAGHQGNQPIELFWGAQRQAPATRREERRTTISVRVS